MVASVARSGSCGREATTSGRCLLVRFPDGGADDVIPFLLRGGPAEGLLQAVREPHHLSALAQPPPDGLALDGGEQLLVHLVEETFPRQILEVQFGAGVPQPDRYRNSVLVGQ